MTENRGKRRYRVFVVLLVEADLLLLQEDQSAHMRRMASLSVQRLYNKNGMSSNDVAR